MIQWKRMAASAAGKAFGVVIVHPSEIHQHPERALLRQFFEHFDVDCVFDVGANAGQYARQLREEVGFKGHIISFEPIPELAEHLRALADRDPRWHIANLALDREAGPATFNVMASNVFSSLHRPAADQPLEIDAHNRVSRQIEVTRATLATEFAAWREKLGFSHPFLKMDTQGNDLAVFDGAGEAIREFTGLQSELSFRRFYAGTPDFNESLAAYSAKGFKLSGLVANTRGHFPDLNEMDCVMYRADAQAPSSIPPGAESPTRTGRVLA